MLELIVIGILVLIFAALAWFVFKNAFKLTWALLANTILGFIALFLFSFFGIHVPINLLTIIVVAIFGVLGAAMLAILSILGML